MGNALRILMVIPRFPPIKLGGAEKQLYQLCPFLAKLGMKITVVTGNAGRKELTGRESRNGFAVERIFEPGIMIGGQRRLNSFGLMASLFIYLIVNHRKFDIIHEHSSLELSVVCCIFSKIFRKRCVAKITGGGENFTPLNLSKKPVFGTLYLKIYQCLDYVLALNSTIEKQCAQIGFKPYQIIPVSNGVAIRSCSNISGTIAAKPGKPTDAISLIMIANLIPVKRIDLFIAALALLKQGTISFSAIIIGEGFERKVLTEAAATAGISERIQFLGIIENVEKHLEAADIAVHTSSAEGMSNAILEEMSFGLPVIASDIAANSAIITDNVNGLLYKNGSTESLRDKLQLLMGDAGLRRRLGENAKKTIEEKYSMEKVAGRYADIYKKIMEPSVNR